MTKYIVKYDSDIYVVANNRADAEEYILSLAEEDALADLNLYMDNHPNFPVSEWFAFHQKRMRSANEHIAGYTDKKPYQTLNGYLLCYCGGTYRISKVVMLDD